MTDRLCHPSEHPFLSIVDALLPRISSLSTCAASWTRYADEVRVWWMHSHVACIRGRNSQHVIHPSRSFRTFQSTLCWKPRQSHRFDKSCFSFARRLRRCESRLRSSDASSRAWWRGWCWSWSSSAWNSTVRRRRSSTMEVRDLEQGCHVRMRACTASEGDADCPRGRRLQPCVRANSKEPSSTSLGGTTSCALRPSRTGRSAVFRCAVAR